MAVITISRQPGTFGEEIAARIAGRLGFTLVDKTYLAGLWREDDLDEAILKRIDKGIPANASVLDPEIETSIKLLADLIAQLAEDQDLVVVGRAAQGLFRNRAGTLHLKVIASRHVRVKQLQRTEGLSARQVGMHIRELENRRTRYLRYLYGMNWNDPSIYDLTLNMDRLSIGQAVNLVLAAVAETRIREVPRNRIVAKLLPETEERHNHGRFVHDAEEQFANFLEFYGITYEYEPRTFALERDAEGRIIEAFTPDFYLPETDLYIELTTMKQSLVTRKNRKVRKLKRLYPDINIRIFYQRDYYRMMAKFGLLENQPQNSPSH
jgi:cytidylate kinase